MVEHARLGRNSSLDSWEDAEGGVELGVGAEAGVGGEGAADFSLLASFFRTASLVLWSAVDETVFLQWFFRKSRSSLVMRLEDLRCSKAMEGSDLSQDLRDVLQDVSVWTGCLCRDKGHFWELETMFKHRNP